jgi:hypothetical protein
VDLLDWAGSITNNATASTTFPAGWYSGDANGRYLQIPASQTLTLAEGTYNFCSIKLGDGAKIVSASPNAQVEIFLDSRRRDTVWGSAVSGCPATAPATYTGTDGTFDGGPADNTAATTGSTIIDGGSGGRFDLFVYGTMAPATKYAAPPPGGGTSGTIVSFGSNSDGRRSTTCGDDFSWRNLFSPAVPVNNVYIFAPNSNVKIASNARIYGGITSCTTAFWAGASTAGFSAPASTVQPPPPPVSVLAKTFRECQTVNPATIDLSYASCKTP